MPSADSPTRPSFEVDKARNSLRFTRDLTSSPARVFAAWTDPEQIACWWDPAGEKLAVCEIDLRPGGSFRFVSAQHPDRPFAGVYREIAPPRLLAFDALNARGRVELEEQTGGTRMTVEIECASAEHLAQFVAMGVADGTSQTLDNLVSFAR
jgi:uncharacterized protein YndB with AHSA1/START domain